MISICSLFKSVFPLREISYENKYSFSLTLFLLTSFLGFPSVLMNKVSAYVDSSIASIRAGAAYPGMQERIGMTALIQLQATFPQPAGLMSNDSRIR